MTALQISRFWDWVGTPFRFMGGIVRSAANMTSVQVRSVFSFAMLGGIMALSVANWVIIGLAHHAGEDGERSDLWFGLIFA